MLNQLFAKVLSPKFFSSWLLVCWAITVFGAVSVQAKSSSAEDELGYGTVLFEFYKKDYFSALVNYSYESKNANRLANNDEGVVHSGGMLLSYGVPDGARDIFNRLLDKTQSEAARNAAWYYLAKMYYNKFDQKQARQALNRVRGRLPRDLHIDYHYLATLVNSDGRHLESNRKSAESIKKDLPEYPYYLFNFALNELHHQREDLARKYFSQVIAYQFLGDEYNVLADRAHHALALLDLDEGNLQGAWEKLQSVRTTGVYSNRALLSYAWAAIKLKKFQDAIPALQMLDSRTIALPEVQEAKVLLAHLYEQEGSTRRALKQNILAEKEFKRGLHMLEQAREIIQHQDVPREFIGNLETVVSETDWYATLPEVDYRKLTPFLLDLLAENNFQETIKELTDLYAMEENLSYWTRQKQQHLLILSESSEAGIAEERRQMVTKSRQLESQLANKKSDLKLMLLTLDVDDQKRFKAQIRSLETQMQQVKARVSRLQKVSLAYTHPAGLYADVNAAHKQVEIKLQAVRDLIKRVEKIMRAQVYVELDRHESRMTYYAAQSRLAKARLFDAALTTLDKAQGLGKERTQTDGETLDAGREPK